MNTTTLAVPIGPCQCPGNPHEEDVVQLREKLGLAAGTQLQALILSASQSQADVAEVTGRLAEAYLLVGVAAWNLVDKAGRPVPVTPDTIRSHLLDDFTRSTGVADQADSLYKGAVIDPLVKRAAPPSRTTTTDGSTSATSTGSPVTRRRSRPSSTSITPMAGTATTSR